MKRPWCLTVTIEEDGRCPSDRAGWLRRQFCRHACKAPAWGVLSKPRRVVGPSRRRGSRGGTTMRGLRAEVIGDLVTLPRTRYIWFRNYPVGWRPKSRKKSDPVAIHPPQSILSERSPTFLSFGLPHENPAAISNAFPQRRHVDMRWFGVMPSVGRGNPGEQLNPVLCSRIWPSRANSARHGTQKPLHRRCIRRKGTRSNVDGAGSGRREKAKSAREQQPETNRNGKIRHWAKGWIACPFGMETPSFRLAAVQPWA
jgi:hypothetical protein